MPRTCILRMGKLDHPYPLSLRTTERDEIPLIANAVLGGNCSQGIECPYSDMPEDPW